jgi:signal transduction histidine kinase
VLETFSAALARTMGDLTMRYKLGEGLKPGRSIKDWTAETMRIVFSWKPQEPELPPPDRSAVRVPVAETAAPRTAAAPGSDRLAAEALVESYAEAAARLTIAVEEQRDENDRLKRRLEELSAPVDAARELLAGAPAPLVLEKVLERVGSALGSDKASLSLVRPDGEIAPVLLRGLAVEPLFACRDEQGQPLAAGLVRGSALVYVAGEPGRLAEALDRLGAEVGSLVAIPVTTVRPLGLLAFYLPSDSPAPNVESMAHLARIGQGLALALEVASGAIASDRLDRMQRTALVGQIAERAMLEIGHPLERLFAAVGRIRNRPDGPPWLLEELLGVGGDLARTREARASVLAFMASETAPSGITDVEELLQQVKTEFEGPLREAGVSLELQQLPEALTIRSDAFLLRCALMVLVNHFRQSLAGLGGARISIRVERVGDSIAISVSDNAEALAAGERTAQVDYLAWSLDRKVSDFGLTLVKALVDHLQGQWRLDNLKEAGNRITLILPAG